MFMRVTPDAGAGTHPDDEPRKEDGVMGDDLAQRCDLMCRQLVELVTDYLCDELDDATTVALETHLLACPGCTDYLWQMRATIAATGRLGRESMDPRTLATVLTAFRDVQTP
jgi:anti-sigma factor RsiW